ncbi:MAG: Lin0512 family protein [Burkholderiaceae bacterium]
MAYKRMAVEIGMGTDLHGQNYTKAAERALRDALWHNSLAVAPAFGFDRDSMMVEVTVAVAQPEQVDTAIVQKVLPYGRSNISVVQGGLDVPHPVSGDNTVIANVIAAVYLDFPEACLAEAGVKS